MLRWWRATTGHAEMRAGAQEACRDDGGGRQSWLVRLGRAREGRSFCGAQHQSSVEFCGGPSIQNRRGCPGAVACAGAEAGIKPQTRNSPGLRLGLRLGLGAPDGDSPGLNLGSRLRIGSPRLQGRGSGAKQEFYRAEAGVEAGVEAQGGPQAQGCNSRTGWAVACLQKPRACRVWLLPPPPTPPCTPPSCAHASRAMPVPWRAVQFRA
eukprot:279297-Chlamydomonas_euryale.AAC.6